MIVIIDNYDSFTYNLHQLIGKFTEDIKVYRNDEVTIKQLEEMDITHLVISPGPKYPSDAGISIEAIKNFSGKIPVLGICLGHQAIAEAFGGKVVKAAEAVHGRTSSVNHTGKEIFKNVKNYFTAARYHSLIVENNTLSEQLKVIATTNKDEIMAITHKQHNTYGLQFHPESFISECTDVIIKEFLKLEGGIKNELDIK